LVPTLEAIMIGPTTQSEEAETAVRPGNADDEATASGSPGTPGSRKAVIVTSIAGAAVLVVGLIVYLIYAHQYVTTDNAQVDGDKIEINSPATGTLTRWDIDQGSEIHANEIVGRIQFLGSFAQPQRVIKAPGRGVVAVNNVVNGSYVGAGTPLAVAYDFSKIYVTARVEESDIREVHPGAPVALDVDAFPGADISGVVEEVQGSSAGSFSLFPQDNTSGNFQKVSQVIPVKIALVNTADRRLVPGMNVTVKIRRSSR
jgi:multidrug resistance efflux pump